MRACCSCPFLLPPIRHLASLARPLEPRAGAKRLPDELLFHRERAASEPGHDALTVPLSRYVLTARRRSCRRPACALRVDEDRSAHLVIGLAILAESERVVIVGTDDTSLGRSAPTD